MKPLEELGKFATVVIDPPWPLKKTGARKTRPNQTGHGNFGYQTMSLEDIGAMPLSSVLENDAFCFLWVTQAFLPHSFSLLDKWGLRYRFTLVWQKNTGPKPFNYPYSNAEFVVVGSVGSPQFLDEKNFKAVFAAPATGHSVKPGEFYQMLNRVTAEPRLDIFGRRRIAGFESWGDEAPEDPALPDHYQQVLLA